MINAFVGFSFTLRKFMVQNAKLYQLSFVILFAARFASLRNIRSIFLSKSALATATAA
jgi:hypothetical protein